jgi:dipeptidyl aminopeptidase/acylaminoacyl peptidase
VIDLSTRRPARVTFDSLGVHPAWSSDGRFVLFSRIVGSVAGIGRVRADGSGTPETALAWPRNIWEAEQTPDGRTVLFRDDNSATVRDIYWAPAESLASAKLLLGSPLNERTIAIAPDGKYFAYLSNASGGDEVYLRRLAEDSPTWPVTSGGGASEPRWARNGRELFFRRGDSLYAVPVTLGAEPRVGEARALFGGRYESSIYHSYYDVAPDGRHFLMVRPQGAEGGPVIHLVLGLFDQR